LFSSKYIGWALGAHKRVFFVKNFFFALKQYGFWAGWTTKNLHVLTDQKWYGGIAEKNREKYRFLTFLRVSPTKKTPKKHEKKTEVRNKVFKNTVFLLKNPFFSLFFTFF